MADPQKPKPLTSEQAEKIVAGVPGMSPSDFTCTECSCNTYNGTCTCNGHSHKYP